MVLAVKVGSKELESSSVPGLAAAGAPDAARMEMSANSASSDKAI